MSKIKIEKAIEISDARIRFVSLVDKAANNKKFLITKAEDGSASFETFGRIVKADAETHYVTGVVYEPLVEDTDGNFMTEEEIRKAAHWFAKNGDQIDVQHSFEAVDGVTVVETYIAPCDMIIGDETIAKGTWLMTVEIEDSAIWEAVEKGDITGFSMGGVGKYGKEDIDLEELTKGSPETTTTTQDQAAEIKADEEATAGKGLMKAIRTALGISAVEKGEVKEKYEKNIKQRNFWSAFDALETTLASWNWETDSRVFVDDEQTIREALADFGEIITNLLTQPCVVKALSSDAAAVEKAGKKISAANKKKLDEACDILTELRDSLAGGEDDITKEDTDMNPQEIKDLVTQTVAELVEKPEVDNAVEEAPVTLSSIQKMIDDTIAAKFEKLPEAKLLEAELEVSEAVTPEAVKKMVSEAIEPLLKARGIPSNLNAEQEPIEKAEVGVFDNFFI